MLVLNWKARDANYQHHDRWLGEAHGRQRHDIGPYSPNGPSHKDLKDARAHTDKKTRKHPQAHPKCSGTRENVGA